MICMCCGVTQRAGGEEKNRHVVLRLCSSKRSAFTADVLRRPRLMPLYSDVRVYCRCTQTSALRHGNTRERVRHQHVIAERHRNGPREQVHVISETRERLCI